jgi:hypothetical protein
MVKPRLSIIVPAYNVESFIAAAVQSALSQSFRDLEIIVVNDGSSDRTLDELSAFNDPRLRIISQENAGLSAARNVGIDLARGEYIGLLDGDDVWHPDKAASHIALLDENPGVGVVQSYCAYIDEGGHDTGQVLVTATEDLSLSSLIARNDLSVNAVLRRSVIDRAGRFNETLRASEDWEMWVRIKHRTECVFQGIPVPLVGYRVRSGSLTTNFDHQIENTRRAIALMRQEVAGIDIDEAVWRRALGEVHRISARKALSEGSVQKARELLIASVQEDPWVCLRSLRGFGTAGLIAAESILPRPAAGKLYGVARRMMKWYFSNTVQPPRREPHWNG